MQKKTYKSDTEAHMQTRITDTLLIKFSNDRPTRASERKLPN